MKKIISLLLVLSLAAAFGTAALASDTSWGEYTMTNDGFGYLTANFPDVFPADAVVPEGTQVVSDKTDAILLTMTEAEVQDMVSAFSGETSEWSGSARMGIPAVHEGTPVSAAEVFTCFDEAVIAETLSGLAASARAAGYNALRLAGLETFPEALADSAQELFAAVMNECGVIAVPELTASSGEPETAAREILTAMGAAGYLQYMQVSRDGLAALDSTPPAAIEPESAAALPEETSDYTIVLPDEIPAGTSVQIVVTAPADTISAMLRDENGENLPIDDMLKENLGDIQQFTYTLTFDTAASMPIYLYTMTTDGWGEEPVASVTADVQ